MFSFLISILFLSLNVYKRHACPGLKFSAAFLMWVFLILLVRRQCCNGSCFVVWTRGLRSSLFNFRMECECVKIPQQHTFKEDAAAAVASPFGIMGFYYHDTAEALPARTFSASFWLGWSHSEGNNAMWLAHMDNSYTGGSILGSNLTLT